MKNRFKIKKEQPVFQSKERLPFEKINAAMTSLGWNSSIEYDQDYGWYILAMKNIPEWGLELRSLKPFNIKTPYELVSAVKLQQRKRSDLLEIIPFKVYKGNRVFFPELSDFMDFMSEAKFPLFRKFFKTSDFSLERVDKSEAKKNKNI